MAQGSDEAPESSRQAQQRSIVAELHRLQAALTPLGSRNSAHLHFLDDEVASRIGPAAEEVGGAGGSPGLQREAFERAVSSLRGAVRAFSKSAVKTHARPGALDRYTSLLRERAQNIAHLQSSLEPVSLLGHRCSQRAPPSLPGALCVGALGPSVELDGPTEHQQATAFLAAVSSAVERLAKGLHLETYAESAAVADSSKDQDTPQATHLLTIGGRILVLDIEFGLRGATQGTGQQRLEPAVSLKVSLTTESSAASGSPVKNKHAALANLLKTDVEAVARAIFGLQPAKSAASVPASAGLSAEEWLMRAATSHWQRLNRNLGRLATIDRFSYNAGSASKESNEGSAANHDLFASLDHVHQVVAGAASLGEDSTSTLAGVTVAHHVGTPFTTIALESSRQTVDDLARSGLNDWPCSASGGLGNALSVDPIALEIDIKAWDWSKVKTSPRYSPKSADVELPLPSHSHSPLSYVARVTPPFDLSRQLSARLARCVGLTTLDGAAQDPHPKREAAMPPTEAELRSSREVAASSTVQVRLVGSASPSDGDECTISTIPFRTMSQLSSVVTVLQQGLWLRRVLAGAGGNVAARPTGLGFEAMMSPDNQSPTVVDVSLDTAAESSEAADDQVVLDLTTSLYHPETLEMWTMEARLRRRNNRHDVSARLVYAEDESRSIQIDEQTSAAAAEAFGEPSPSSVVAVAEALVTWAKKSAGIAETVAPAVTVAQETQEDAAAAAMEVDEPQVEPRAALAQDVAIADPVEQQVPPSAAQSATSTPNSRKRRGSARIRDGSGSPTGSDSRPMTRRRSSQQSQAASSAQGAADATIEPRSTRRSLAIATNASADRSVSPEQQRRSQSPLVTRSPTNTRRKSVISGGRGGGSERPDSPQTRRRSSSSRGNAGT
ncbi:unnamed protein product [Parajaminaea phylloscopi]